MNKEFEYNFIFKCIWHEIIALYYLEYNGVIECDNHSIKMVKRMLYANDMQFIFWLEVVTTIIYLFNHVASHCINHKTPLKF
jgi:hypothetical protein